MTERSEALNELASALSGAQAEFTTIPKGDFNPFFKSKYAGLPAVIETAAPILAKHGLSVSQHLGFDGQNDTLTTYLMHSSGQFISESMRLYLNKNDAQSQGSATTYARRYSYMSVLGLVADVDDDGQLAKTQPTVAQERPTRGRRGAPLSELKQTNNQTGEVTHNLQAFMLAEVTESAQRAALMKVLTDKRISLTTVPEGQRAEVEALIAGYGAGRPL